MAITTKDRNPRNNNAFLKLVHIVLQYNNIKRTQRDFNQIVQSQSKLNSLSSNKKDNDFIRNNNKFANLERQERADCKTTTETISIAIPAF